MIWEYHERVVARAEAAASKGHLVYLLGGIWRDAAVWALPPLAAVLICPIFGLYGQPRFWVSLPAVGVTLLGSCGYVPWVYLGALKRRWSGS
jgi:hypothetical protein